MKHGHGNIIAALALGAVLSGGASADDAFLKLSDIAGDSTDPQHPNEIALLSYSFGMEAESSWTRGGGVSVGKPNPGDLRITAATDRSLAGMVGKITEGKNSPTAVLSVRSSAPGNRTGFEYIRYTFTGVFFTSVDQALAGNGRAVTGASMIYRTLQIEQFSPANGTRVSCVSWDIPAGAVEDCNAPSR
jgi:type VI secretion system secreted protein Hcp